MMRDRRGMRQRIATEGIDGMGSVVEIKDKTAQEGI
jgi:hypothetical protein